MDDLYNLVNNLLLEANEKIKHLEMVPTSRLFDLTSRRYHIFRETFKDSNNLTSLLSYFQTKYPLHSSNLILDVTADMVYNMLSQESYGSDKVNIINIVVKETVNKLEKDKWSVFGSFPINNIIWDNGDDEEELNLIRNRIRVYKNIESISYYSGKSAFEVDYTGFFNYIINKSKKNYEYLLEPSRASDLIWIFILGLRLLQFGDVETNKFEIYLEDNYRRMSYYLDLFSYNNYQNIDYVIEKGEELIYYDFCTQLYKNWNKIKHIKRIKIITTNFMDSYKRHYLDRYEIYYRIIQSIFRKGRGRKANVEATNKLLAFLGMNELHEKLSDPKSFFKKTYGDRGGITHGEEDYSELNEVEVFNNNNVLELYCRQAIFYQISFSLNGKNDYLKNFNIEMSKNNVRNLKIKIQKEFWKDSNVKAITKDDKELSPVMWL